MTPAIRKVVRLGRPVLRTKTRELTPKEIVSEPIKRLVGEMEATMHEYEGVGIAGNQVGEDLAVFVMGLEPGSPRWKDGIERTVVFNPKVKFLSEKLLEDWEGCLSVPGLRGRVPRRAALELSGLGEDGKPFHRRYEDFPARVVQHECDHLAGFVYLDRMDGLSTLCYLSQV